MQSGFTAHITRSEWSWVILVSVVLVLLAFIPYALIIVTGVDLNQWQFMGMLHNPSDGATYLSKMILGMHGEWQVRFLHTSEPHNGAFIQVIYPLLGHLARLIGAPVLVVFHAVRAVAAVFMYMALYQLAATIWMRIRTRRLFFVLASLSAGVGWLYVMLTGGKDINIPDLMLPEAFPFYSTLMNVHFPLTTGCLALLAGVMLEVFRPGEQSEPTWRNGGLTVALLSLIIALLYPQGLVPVTLALGAYVALLWYSTRSIPWWAARWLALIVLPAVPMAVYYAVVVWYNPAMKLWGQQNVTAATPPWTLLIGFAFPLLIGFPALVRAVRRFSAAYDDRFMLLWLVMIIVAMYVPTAIQRRFAVGMLLPLAYFATRALESFWFEHIPSARWRSRLLVMALPVMMLSQLFVLFIPLLPALVNRPEEAKGLFIERDYMGAMAWLAGNSSTDAVVLAAPEVSLWLPGWSSVNAVYAHPYETLNADQKLQQVTDWYAGRCNDLLEIYNVDYVLYGPREVAFGAVPTCLTGLQEIGRNGDVVIYAP